MVGVNIALVSTEGYPTFDSRPDLHFGGMSVFYTAKYCIFSIFVRYIAVEIQNCAMLYKQTAGRGKNRVCVSGKTVETLAR